MVRAVPGAVFPRMTGLARVGMHIVVLLDFDRPFCRQVGCIAGHPPADPRRHQASQYADAHHQQQQFAPQKPALSNWHMHQRHCGDHQAQAQQKPFEVHWVPRRICTRYTTMRKTTVKYDERQALTCADAWSRWHPLIVISPHLIINCSYIGLEPRLRSCTPMKPSPGPTLTDARLSISKGVNAPQAISAVSNIARMATWHSIPPIIQLSAIPWQRCSIGFPACGNRSYMVSSSCSH